MKRILLLDSTQGGTHYLNMITSLNQGYGEDISDQIDIRLFDTYIDALNRRDDIYEEVKDTSITLFLQSIVGANAGITYVGNYYPGIQAVSPHYNNNFAVANYGANNDYPHDAHNIYAAIACGAGNEQNRTSYGLGLEFWDVNNIGLYQSFSAPLIAGKLLKIKDTLNCDWWTARYLARMTADRNEPNRVGELWDLYNGYGKINVQAAIEAYGSVEIPTDPYLPPPPPEPLTDFEQIITSFYNEKITLTWNDLGDATYEIFRKQGKFEDWQSLGTTTEITFVNETVQRCADLTYYKIKATHNELPETKESEVVSVPFYKIGRIYQRGG